MDRWTLWQTCAAQSWDLHWGDADVLGLVLTFLYATAAVMTTLTAVQVWRLGSKTSSHWLWALAAIYVVLLAINKQLDLQTFITQTGRCMARAEGWYAERRGVQEVATLAILAAGALAGVVLIVKSRRGNGLMIFGLGLLSTYIALRILSFHHMDSVLKTPLFGLGLARVIELSSLLVIISAAATKTPSA